MKSSNVPLVVLLIAGIALALMGVLAYNMNTQLHDLRRENAELRKIAGVDVSTPEGFLLALKGLADAGRASTDPRVMSATVVLLATTGSLLDGSIRELHALVIPFVKEKIEGSDKNRKVKGAPCPASDLDRSRFCTYKSYKS